jgi:hypothetical protein
VPDTADAWSGEGTLIPNDAVSALAVRFVAVATSWTLVPAVTDDDEIVRAAWTVGVAARATGLETSRAATAAAATRGTRMPRDRGCVPTGGIEILLAADVPGSGVRSRHPRRRL